MSNILYIDGFLPLYDHSSGSHRLWELLKLLLADGHHVNFMPHSILLGQEKYQKEIQDLGINLIKPISLSHTLGTVTDSLNRLKAAQEVDTVIISFHHLATVYLPIVKQFFPNARFIIDTVDLHWVRERRQAELANDAELFAKAEQTYVAEIASYQAADALIAISENERAVLLREIPDATVFVIPNVHSLDDTPIAGYEKRNGLLFVGNFWHPPNGEGILWFCTEVWPRLIRRIPTLTLDIIGQDPPAELMRFVNNQVRVHGWVQSLDPFLNRSRISIAPLLHGAGQKGKVGEALAFGLPVVTTSIGAEGMGLNNGVEVMIADGAEAFADAIATVTGSPDLWHSLSENGREVINRSFTPAAVRTAVRRVVPAPGAAAISYFGVPDWESLGSLESVLRQYFDNNAVDSTSVLNLGVLDLDVQDAFDQLAGLIGAMGYDLNAIPDVSLTPLASTDLGFLADDTIWVPLREDIAKPEQLTSVAEFASVARASAISTR